MVVASRHRLRITFAVQQRANNFDFLRFVAALAVVGSHSVPLSYGTNDWEPLFWLSRHQTSFGKTAVYVFFAMSGYLITASYQRRPEPGIFVRSRLLRLVPALIPALVGWALIVGPFLTALPPGQYFRDLPAYLPAYLGVFFMSGTSFLPGMFEDNPFRLTVFGSLWTLFYEALMYVVVLVLGIAGILNRTVVTTLWVVSLLLSWRWVGGDAMDFATDFLGGATLWMWRDRVPMDGRLALAALAVCAAGCVSGFRLAFATAGAYAAVYLATSPRVRLPSVERFGDLSYGTYIYAFPVQQAAALALGAAATWYWNLAISLPIVLGLAWLSWHYVEKPALMLKRRRAPVAEGTA